MLEAYSSGDPYLAFGKQAGRIPQHGTKESHLQVREQFKTCALGVQYGMKARSLATRIIEDIDQETVCSIPRDLDINFLPG